MKTAQEIAYRVDRDGLDFCLRDIKAREIDDPGLAMLWREAQDLIMEIEDMLPDPFDYEEEGDDAA